MVRKSVARVACILCLLLSLPPSGAVGEELSSDKGGALRALLAFMPETVRSWFDEPERFMPRRERPVPRQERRALKCSGGIDPNGKPCP